MLGLMIFVAHVLQGFPRKFLIIGNAALKFLTPHATIMVDKIVLLA